MTTHRELEERLEQMEATRLSLAKLLEELSDTIAQSRELLEKERAKPSREAG